MRFIDHTGARFGKIVVLGRAPDGVRADGKPQVLWRCACDCGKEVIAKSGAIKGRKRCGCRFRAREAGERFGRLVVMARANEKNSSGNALWKCRCDCGAECVATLMPGTARSCGCLGKEAYAANGRKNALPAGEAKRRNRECRLSFAKRGIEGLGDWYIKQVLNRTLERTTGLRAKDIPEVMIDAKRAHLKVQRLIKEKSK
jgi:hypothetical protein